MLVRYLSKNVSLKFLQSNAEQPVNEVNRAQINFLIITINEPKMAKKPGFCYFSHGKSFLHVT
jgi:hypothetical protein